MPEALSDVLVEILEEDMGSDELLDWLRVETMLFVIAAAAAGEWDFKGT